MIQPIKNNREIIAKRRKKLTDWITRGSRMGKALPHGIREALNHPDRNNFPESQIKKRMQFISYQQIPSLEPSFGLLH